MEFDHAEAALFAICGSAMLAAFEAQLEKFPDGNALDAHFENESNMLADTGKLPDFMIPDQQPLLRAA